MVMPPIPTIPRPPRKDKENAPPTIPTVPTDNRGKGGNGGEGAASGADTPPRSRAGSAPRAGSPGDSAPTGGARAPRPSQLETKLGEFFGSFSLAFSLAGDDYCAWIVAERSPQLAHSWAELAKQNPAVKRVLEGLVEGSAWGGVILSSLSIALPIAKHHGVWRGPDPFAMILPGPPAETDKNNRGNNGNGGVAESFQWSKGGDAPAPVRNRSFSSSDDDEQFMSTMPGSPPGVVTVASTTASHPGAR